MFYGFRAYFVTVECECPIHVEGPVPVGRAEPDEALATMAAMPIQLARHRTALRGRHGRR
jgi:hypothetical protein